VRIVNLEASSAWNTPLGRQRGRGSNGRWGPTLRGKAPFSIDPANAVGAFPRLWDHLDVVRELLRYL